MKKTKFLDLKVPEKLILKLRDPMIREKNLVPYIYSKDIAKKKTYNYINHLPVEKNIYPLNTKIN